MINFTVISCEIEKHKAENSASGLFSTFGAPVQGAGAGARYGKQ